MDSLSQLQPVFYKFRFTFTEQDKTHEYEPQIARWKAITRALVNKLTSMYQIEELTGGCEQLNKRGERTWYHTHIHFSAIENKETISRMIKRFLSDTYNQEVTGVKAYSFKPDHPRDKRLFFQYPLKQMLDFKMCYGFTESDLQILHLAAKSSYEIVCQVNNAKMDKKDNLDSLFERLKMKLEQSQEIKKGKLLVIASKFYVEEQRPLNRATISGYVDCYMLEKEIITHEQYWELS